MRDVSADAFEEDEAMETATRVGPRPVDFAGETRPTMPPEAGLQLVVSATYLLSEEGRKASLLAGGNGRALQEVIFKLPTNRLHLVRVDTHGRSRLKLRPRFELNAEQRVVRIDALPTYDAPPTLEDLCRDAGRNHQLEHAFRAERSAARAAQRDLQRRRRDEIAEAFLKDPAQRPMRRPSPTPQFCCVSTSEGRMSFDVKKDAGPARLVPPEAYRRWRADLHIRKARRKQETVAQIASHEHKLRVVADWIQRYGTAEQQARQAAGVLPIEHAIDAMTDQAFVAGDAFERYVFDGARDLQQRLRQLPHYGAVVINPTDIRIFGTDAAKATEAQWVVVQQLQQVFPDATVTLREHRIAWRGDPHAPTVTKYGVLVTRKVGLFDLRREYAAPDA
jgi:hypothetical protein